MSFGETVTLDNHTRAASIFSEQDLFMMSLSNVKYRKVFSKDIEHQSFVLAKMLKTFTNLNTKHIVNLSYQFKEEVFDLNQTIFKPQEPCTYLYLVKKGVVELNFIDNSYEFPLESKVLKMVSQFFGMEDIWEGTGKRTFTAKSVSAKCHLMRVQIDKIREN